MRDFARSDDAAVQAQLDRLAALSLPQGRLGLDTVRAMLARLGDPHLALPPVFHVAGTNGKGSTCAFLRAMLEADGKRVHVFTSPHLVRFNERIRLAGNLISDAALAALLAEVLDAAESAGLGPSFFEVTTAAAFLAFARTPADACVIEVGLGGRLDATNVLERPAACGIATLGFDHEQFLLVPEEGVTWQGLARIGFEKAGIAKRGVPLVTQSYPADAARAVAQTASAARAELFMRGQGWRAEVGETIAYADCFGPLDLPLPAMPGAHQADNAALAVAILRHQDKVPVAREVMASGILAARWPARMQRLGPGPLADLAQGREAWLDGGHNPDAGAALARHFAGRKLHLVLGMLANKDARALTGPLAGNLLSLSVVPVPGHAAHPPEVFAGGRAFSDVPSALALLPEDGAPVLIAGSLYLAGEVLRLNREWPS